MNEIPRLESGVFVREVPGNQNIRLLHGPDFVDAGSRERESVVEGGQSVAPQIDVQQLLKYLRRSDEEVAAGQ